MNVVNLMNVVNGVNVVNVVNGRNGVNDLMVGELSLCKSVECDIFLHKKLPASSENCLYNTEKKT